MKLSKYHKSSVSFRDHQHEALSHLSKAKRFLLALPTGTGKTLTSLSAFAYAFEFNTITRAIFVLEPKNAIQTENEVKDKFSGLTTLVVTGKTPKVRRNLYNQFNSNPDHKILIINYELMKNDLDEIAKIFHNHKIALVFDEATKFKNRETKVHKVVARLSSMSHRTIALTATPVMNSLQDIHSINQAIGIHVVSDWEFFNKHAEWETKQFGRRKIRTIKSYKDIDKYYGKISNHFYSKKKSDILDVSFAYSPRYLSLGSHEREALKMVAEVGNIAQLAIAMSCPCLITGKDEDLLSEKEADLIDFIENELDNKMMVYSPFKSVIKRLEEILNNKYGKDFAVAIHGDISNPEPAKNKIINNPKTRVLLGTSSLEKGMDGIQAVVDTEYFFTLPISAGSYLQLLGRTSRDGGIFNMITVAIPFVGNNLLDHSLYVLIQNQLRLIRQVTPDSIEEGCIDESVEEMLPEENAMNPNTWLKSKINVHQYMDL